MNMQDEISNDKDKGVSYEFPTWSAKEILIQQLRVVCLLYEAVCQRSAAFPRAVGGQRVCQTFVKPGTATLSYPLLLPTNQMRQPSSNFALTSAS